MAKDLSSLLKELKGFGEQTDKFLKAEIAAIGFQIEADAKVNASAIPDAPPEVKQMISNQILNDGYTAKITQNALPMGAYIEFGTGVFVTVAPEWKDMAWQFYVNGKGRLHAHPYMYPAFLKGRDDFMNTLQRKIDILAQQFNKS
jgi:hypothetical protein